MAFKVTDMAAYIQGKPEQVMKEIMVEGQSMTLLTVQEGIKEAAKVIDVQNDATNFRGADNTAVDRFSGGVKLSDVEIKVTPLGISELYAAYKLNGTVAQLALKAGSNPEDMPFQDIIMGIKGNSIVKENEKLIWRGQAGTNSFDGIETQLLASASALKTGAAGTALNASNALSKVNAFCDKYEEVLPDNMDAEENILAMSPKNFAAWYRAAYKLTSAIDSDTMNTAKLPKEAMIPGRNIKAVALYGMTGSDNLIASRPENFVIGTDLKSESDQVRFRFESFVNSYALEADYKLGVAIARPNEVLITKA